MINYFVYAIKSKLDNRIYVGISKDPEKRLISHNNGETKSTKYFRPWELIYFKLIGSRKEARQEELRLKTGYGKEWLKAHIKKY